MKKSSRLTDIMIALAVVLYFGGSLPAVGQAASKKTPDASNSPRATAPARSVGSGSAHVYLLRGLMNIFSLGMDDLAQKIQRSGVAATVHEHGHWESLSDEIAAKYKAGSHGAIVLIGHSLGADAVMLMGERLGTKGVPVALIVPFDATRSLAATGNIARVMNITQRDYAYMKRGYGFRGELANVDVSGDESIGHISIDKSARLHAMVVNKVVSVVGKGGGAVQASAPAGDLPVSPPLPKQSPAPDLSAKVVPSSPTIVTLAHSTAAGLVPEDLASAQLAMPQASNEAPASTTNTSLEFQLLPPRSQN